MSAILDLELALSEAIKGASGVDDMEYYGSTIAAKGEPRGVIECTSVNYEGTLLKTNFNVAIGFYGESPSELKESLYGAAEKLQIAFKSKGAKGLCVCAAGSCSNAKMGPNGIKFNSIEGYAESSVSSKARHFKASMGFTIECSRAA